MEKYNSVREELSYAKTVMESFLEGLSKNSSLRTEVNRIKNIIDTTPDYIQPYNIIVLRNNELLSSCVVDNNDSARRVFERMCAKYTSGWSEYSENAKTSIINGKEFTADNNIRIVIDIPYIY